MSRRRHRHKKDEGRELHDAIWSLGSDNRTSRLSDAEFGRQMRKEAGDLLHYGGSCVSGALGALVCLFRLLFCASE